MRRIQRCFSNCSFQKYVNECKADSSVDRTKQTFNIRPAVTYGVTYTCNPKRPPYNSIHIHICKKRKIT